MFCYIFVYNHALVVICGVAVLENCVECTDNETQVKLNALYISLGASLLTHSQKSQLGQWCVLESDLISIAFSHWFPTCVLSKLTECRTISHQRRYYLCDRKGRFGSWS